MKPFIIPLLAALAHAASMILAKVGLTRRRISIRDFIPGLFLFLTLFSAMTLVPFGYIQLSAFNVVVLGQLGAIIVVSIMWNVLYYMALRKEKANTSEGIMILVPLVTMGASWLVDPSDFNVQIVMAAVVATAIVAWVYHNKKSLRVGRDGLLLGGAVVFMALENVLVAQLLQQQIISPATLYAMRTFMVFLVLCAYYRPSFKRLNRKTLWFLAGSALVGASAMLLKFYGLRDAGVTLTALALILTPVFTFCGAALFLREKLKPSRVVALVAISLLVIYATYLNY